MLGFGRHRATVYTGPALRTRHMRNPTTYTGVGDLERSLARLNAAGLGGGMGRDAMKVVLYEDNAKRRVAAMIAGLRGLQTLNQAFKGFQAVLPALASGLLQQLLTPGKGFPELDGPLDALEGATDWHEAATSGRATPKPVCMSPCSQCLILLMAMPVTLHPVLCFGCKNRIGFYACCADCWELAKSSETQHVTHQDVVLPACCDAHCTVFGRHNIVAKQASRTADCTGWLAKTFGPASGWQKQ